MRWRSQLALIAELEYFIMKSTLLISLTLVATLANACYGKDEINTVPVNFEKGSSSSTLQGSFKGYGSVLHTLVARAGQKMTIRITGSRNANFNIFAPGQTPGSSAALGSGYVGGDWSGTLSETGRYTVQVYQPRATARRGTEVAYSIYFRVQ